MNLMRIFYMNQQNLDKVYRITCKIEHELASLESKFIHFEVNMPCTYHFKNQDENKSCQFASPYSANPKYFTFSYTLMLHKQ